jgi:hypothetical protein
MFESYCFGLLVGTLLGGSFVFSIYSWPKKRIGRVEPTGTLIDRVVSRK